MIFWAGAGRGKHRTDAGVQGAAPGNCMGPVRVGKWGLRQLFWSSIWCRVPLGLVCLCAAWCLCVVQLLVQSGLDKVRYHI